MVNVRHALTKYQQWLTEVCAHHYAYATAAQYASHVRRAIAAIGPDPSMEEVLRYQAGLIKRSARYGFRTAWRSFADYARTLGKEVACPESFPRFGIQDLEPYMLHPLADEIWQLAQCISIDDLASSYFSDFKADLDRPGSVTYRGRSIGVALEVLVKMRTWTFPTFLNPETPLLRAYPEGPALKAREIAKIVHAVAILRKQRLAPRVERKPLADVGGDADDHPLFQ